ncbi:hypothetical protein L1D19_05720 [Vibrio natriegens]|uniref:hypothetical protein n=1 Tax=Vibrio natriegens TaxID=691 RepID=UPI001EFC370D|nr:hypothetical protein [Vibrio natriegens]MCG9699629.1 hypothetical protein [Vibrio natriegens]
MTVPKNEREKILRLEIAGLEMTIESIPKDIAKDRTLTKHSKHSIVRFFSKANGFDELPLTDSLEHFKVKLERKRMELAKIS